MNKPRYQYHMLKTGVLYLAVICDIFLKLSPSSGIATIVGVGVAGPKLTRMMMECHTLALAQVSGVRVATVLSLRGSNHTVFDSANYTVQPCSLQKSDTTSTMGGKQNSAVACVGSCYFGTVMCLTI